jgi:hypothetical protein
MKYLMNDIGARRTLLDASDFVSLKNSFQLLIKVDLRAFATFLRGLVL